MEAKSKKRLTIQEAMEMDAGDLMDYLNELCTIEIPSEIETVDDMRLASNLMSRCTNLYSYLSTMQMMAKVKKRQYKRNISNKQLAEDALVREEIFGNYAEIMKVAKETVSRMVTIKQQINMEMRMIGDHIT